MYSKEYDNRDYDVGKGGVCKESGKAWPDSVGMLVEGMKAIRLYILNSDDREYAARVAYELLSLGNKLIKVSCGDKVVDKGCVVEALFEMCIDELEFVVCSDFDNIIDELDYALNSIGYDVNMEFVVEVEDGYVYLTPHDVKRMVLDEKEYDEEQ